MEVKVLLDKENNVFLTKSVNLNNMEIDDNGNLVIKGDDIEIKFTPLDAIKLSQFSMEIMSKFGLNFLVSFNNIKSGDNNESKYTESK